MRLLEPRYLISRLRPARIVLISALLAITLCLSSTDTAAVPLCLCLLSPLPILPIPRLCLPPTLHSAPHHFLRGEQCTTGALLAPTQAGGERRGGGGSLDHPPR